MTPRIQPATQTFNSRILAKIKPYISKEKYNTLKKIKTKEDWDISLDFVQYGVADFQCEQMLKKINEKVCNTKEIVKKGKTTLTIEQGIYKYKNIAENNILKFYKMFIKKDTNPEILQIKRNLNKKYKLKTLKCGNNLEFTKALEKGLDIANKNHLKIPKNIYYSEVSPGSITIGSYPNESIIYNKSAINNDFPDLHVIIHEIVHFNQPNLLASNIKKINKRDREIANGVSDYAYNNFSSEIHAELLSKKILGKLSYDEEVLLKKLNDSLLLG